MGIDGGQAILIDDTQIVSAGMILAEAFFTDAFNQYVFPDSEERLRVLPWYFAASVREGALLKSAYAVVEPVRGVAVWTPPGLHERTPERAKQSGLDQMREQFGSEAYHRFIGTTGYVAHCSSQVVTPACWYLSLIGVSPSCQGQGIGGAVLAPMLRQLDREGVACYLETFEEKNVGFYQRHGFQVAVTGVEPQSQLRFWVMRREALHV